MTRHKITHQPRFDFRDAAFEALADFPQLRETTVFLLAQQNPAGQGSIKAYGEVNTVAKHTGHATWRAYLRGFLNYMREHNTSVACFVKDIPYRAVIFTPHSVLSPVHADRAAMLFFEFDHELGHLLTRHGREITTKGTTTRAEISAEAFATLRSIQRFGGAREHLEALSRFRAQGFVAQDIRSHITTPVIDAILADCARVDFTKLTMDETIAAANEYAQRCCPSKPTVDFAAAQLNGAREFKTNGIHQQRLATMLATLNNSFAFTVGARALIPVLASDINAQLPKDLRNSMIIKIQSRALKLGLNDTAVQLAASSGITLHRPGKHANRTIQPRR